MRTQWTQERCEKLERLWTAGMSATNIGVTLGLTRGAVLGKLDRLGLLRRGGVMRAKVCNTATSDA